MVDLTKLSEAIDKNDDERVHAELLHGLRQIIQSKHLKMEELNDALKRPSAGEHISVRNPWDGPRLASEITVLNLAVSQLESMYDQLEHITAWGRGRDLID